MLAHVLASATIDATSIMAVFWRLLAEMCRQAWQLPWIFKIIVAALLVSSVGLSCCTQRPRGRRADR
jgi:hypothetical protein